MEQIGFPIFFALCVIAGGIVFLSTVWQSLDRILLALDGELASEPQRAEPSAVAPTVRYEARMRTSRRPVPASVRALARGRPGPFALKA